MPISTFKGSRQAKIRKSTTNLMLQTAFKVVNRT
jgi:hypothetical protein